MLAASEAAGVNVIQIDEAALREGLPLRKSQWKEYLNWAVESFRITANGVSDETQIHTHMCYAEFNDIIEAIEGPLRVTACSTDAENCGQYSKCSVRDPLWKIKDRIVSALSDCSLQEIASESFAEPPIPVAFALSRTTAE